VIGRVIIAGIVAFVVFLGVYLALFVMTPQVGSLLEKQRIDFAQMERQLAELDAEVPSALDKLTKDRDFIHGQRARFSGAQGALRPATFMTINLAYEVTEADMRGAILLLSNLGPAQRSEEASLSLLKENNTRYDRLWHRNIKDAGEGAKQHESIIENNKRREALLGVADQIISFLGNIILQHEQQWLKLQNGVESLQALQGKDEETVQSIKLQNTLLQAGSQAILLEKKYHDNLGDVLSRLKAAARIQDGLAAVIK
jgi:hypothetical protein